MPPKARNGFTQHAAPRAAPCSSRTCAIGRRSNAHSAARRLNGLASFRGFLPGALSNACPSGPGRPSRLAREGQASNKARPKLTAASRLVSASYRPNCSRSVESVNGAAHHRCCGRETEPLWSLLLTLRPPVARSRFGLSPSHFLYRKLIVRECKTEYDNAR